MRGPQPGTVLASRYQLQALVGQGGMGEVWSATDSVLDRHVAVKILTGALLRKEGTRERFRREARSVAGLMHPRIANVLDYAEADGAAFIVMELLTGETLADRLHREHRVRATEAAAIAAQTAEGLQAAHDAGIIHRDVKPANIMLTTSGLKLLDFGIAATAWDAGLTTTNTLFGTGTYLPPERAAGQPATPACDVYSLGVVLYEMLAGQPPFAADNPLALMSAHATAMPEALPSEVPGELAGICYRALAKDPTQRPDSAQALATEIRQAVPSAAETTIPLSAHVVPPPTRPRTAQLPSDGATGRPLLRADVAQRLRQALASGRRHHRPLAGLLAAAALLVLLVALILPDEPQPTAAPPAAPPATAPTPSTTTSRPAPPPPAPAAPVVNTAPAPPTMATAVAHLRQTIQAGASSGQIRDDVATDLEHAVSDLQDQLAKRHTNDVAHRVTDLTKRVRDRTRDGGITSQAAATLQSALQELATAANTGQN